MENNDTPDYKLACEMHLKTIQTQARIIGNYQKERAAQEQAKPSDPYAAITLGNLKAGKLTAERVYVAYCELKGELEATNGAIERYKALAAHPPASPSTTDWRPYHSALSQCAALLDNMADNDALIDTPKYLAAALASRSSAPECSGESGGENSEESGWAYGRAKSGKPIPRWSEVQQHAEECGGRVVANKLSFPTSEGKVLFDIWYAENAPASYRVRSVFKPFAPAASSSAALRSGPADSKCEWPTCECVLDLNNCKAKLAATAPTVAAPSVNSVVAAWKGLVDQCVAVLNRHIVPDGISDHEALCELYGILDGPDYRNIADIDQDRCDDRQREEMTITRSYALAAPTGASQSAGTIDTPEFREVLSEALIPTGASMSSEGLQAIIAFIDGATPTKGAL